ncbi:uncharacterized protein LOC110029289 [Phalaenopsis equestris]|uniref:uncharacterized protein LOC110029289 n=1 Tax=Phalaenopsis equestris TaxID=78828 RepID=UPI0009E4F869|nr:uncharacterized protein LOC110029289 [Phalaenopsis equestris]
MGSESVASCRQPSSPSPGIPFLADAQNAQKNNFERPNKGACFLCHEEGHWVRDCPNRSNRTPGSGSPTAVRRNYPEMQCPCGYGACIVLTSRTVKNPGRDFYRCPGKQSEQCAFFKWCDEAASGQSSKLKSPMNHANQLDGSDNPNPICSCGAGKCIRLTMHDGEYAGRQYFACPIKKGQGACNHFEWYDSAIKAKKVENSDCLHENPYLPARDNEDACEVVKFVKSEDIIARVSPLRKDPMFLEDSEAWKRDRGLKDTHNFISKEGAFNHLQLFESTTKAGKIEHENYDYSLEKPYPPTPDSKQARKTIYETRDTVAPVRPLLQDQRDSFLQISPVKRLSLRDDSPDSSSSKHKRCPRFGGEGNCSNGLSSSSKFKCIKCGRFGHTKYNCQV